MLIINTKNQLTNFLSKQNKISVYGAAYRMYMLFSILHDLGYSNDIVRMIFVSNAFGNPESYENIPVSVYDSSLADKDEYIILTIGYSNMNALSAELEKCGLKTVCLSKTLYSEFISPEYAYNEVYDILHDFIKDYPYNVSGMNTPVDTSEKYAWTCWWQGLDLAPDIIKACINSQKRNLPSDVKHVIITESNYKDYIDIPSYILEKVNNGLITLTTFSDIIRACLIYKYGGIWMDATVLMHRQMPVEYWDHALYSCKGINFHFGSFSHLSLWFLGGHSGQELFRFAMEAFFWYYSRYDRIKYYLMVDYIYTAALDSFYNIRKQADAIPVNNENAAQLILHLDSGYDKEKFDEYVSETFIQKLTWKTGRYNQNLNNKNSIYSYILSEYL